MAANILQSVARLLQPPIVPPSSEYNGTEFKYWKFAFRPAQYKIDPLIFALAAIYVIAYVVGSGSNRSRVAAWWREHLPLYTTQFSKPTSGITTEPIRDGAATFLVYSCGRRHLKSLHTVFNFNASFDLIYSIIDFCWSLVSLNYRNDDILDLEFELAPNVGGSAGWVWAVVTKDVMEAERKKKWELTFTKASDSTVLPKSMILMAESADVHEALLKSLSNSHGPARNFLSILNSEAIQPYFRSLTVTDQPSERPYAPISPEKRTHRIVLSLVVPPVKKAAVSLPLITAIFDMIDILGSSPPSLRPETTKRLRTRREELDVELKKDAERERKEEELDEKMRERKREKEEAVMKMSAAEQKKQLEKEQKRNMRKAQGKMVKKA